MKTEQFFDESGAPYFCVIDGRGHKICRVASIGEGDSWIDEIRALMDRGSILILGEKLEREAFLTEEPEEPEDDDDEGIIIYHAYMSTIHRYRVIEALEARKMEQAQER